MLPTKDWLHIAKRLAVGQRLRVVHGRERRANMIVENNAGHYRAYCQACKEGGYVSKDHVVLATRPKVQENTLIVPTDLVRVIGSEHERGVMDFLVSKNMMDVYLPLMWVSPKVKRLYLQDNSLKWHGRALYESNNAKWLHYGATSSVVGDLSSTTTIVVEDLFSMFKVEYALRGHPARVYCTLGAHLKNHNVVDLMVDGVRNLIWLYDADDAGDTGYTHGAHRMRQFGKHQARARPPDNLDPKDMQINALRDLLLPHLRRFNGN